jgi:hypothetical protein
VTGIDDRDLRERFAELRVADRALARGVSETLERTQPERRVRRASRAAIAIASTAAVLIAIVLIRRDGRPAPIPVNEWRPQTDVLLWAARPPLLGSMPPLGASVLDPYLHTQSR